VVMVVVVVTPWLKYLRARKSLLKTIFPSVRGLENFLGRGRTKLGGVVITELEIRGRRVCGVSVLELC